MIVDPALVRNERDGFRRACERAGVRPRDFDVVLEWPDPTEWVAWQLGTVVPRLAWKPEYDELWRKFPLDDGRTYVAAHVSTETAQYYGYVKDWPVESWRELFAALGAEAGVGCILLGHARSPRFDQAGIVDLRGETTLLEMLSVLRNRCRVLVAPDGGVLTTGLLPRRGVPADRRVALVGSAAGDPEAGGRLAEPAARARPARRRGRGRAADPGR